MGEDFVLKIFVLAISYLIGSISPAFLIAKYIFKFDIRTRGSGNPGTTNALRTMGPKVAIVTLIFDISKAMLSAFIGLKLIGPEFAPYAGLMAILGHNFPFYLGFKGGKGVASSIGMAFIIAPKILAICGGIGLLVLFATRMVSAASVTGFIILLIISIYKLVGGEISSHVIVFIFIACLNIIRHRKNILRIINGTESKIGK